MYAAHHNASLERSNSEISRAPSPFPVSGGNDMGREEGFEDSLADESVSLLVELD